jgi:hypothetical protein
MYIIIQIFLQWYDVSNLLLKVYELQCKLRDSTAVFFYLDPELYCNRLIVPPKWAQIKAQALRCSAFLAARFTIWL